MVWKIDDPQGDEAGKIAHRVIPYAIGKDGVDIGCGPSKIFPTAVGVDNCKDTSLFGIPINPDIDSDVMHLPFKEDVFDWAFSSHTLEHLDDPRSALKEWMRVVKPGGFLILYLPHKDLYPRAGTEGANPDHKHDFDNKDVQELMPLGWEMLANEIRSCGREYSLFQVYRKCQHRQIWPIAAKLVEDKVYKRTACVVRYGGFGDVLQAAMVLPALKQQDYHVSFMTTPKGKDILQGNPYIDEFIVQGEGQVPQHALPGYWEAWRPEFSKWVNLSETVEGTLLTVPGRANHLWPDEVRRKRCNVNYSEFTAQVAEVPFEKTEKVFYPTQGEKLSAEEILNKGSSVLWALSGSAQHKFYPGMDSVIAMILLKTDAHIYLVGDMACKILEAGWEQEDRVHCLSGELSMRDTLTMAQMVDVVMGPETGVLNSVAYTNKVGKVCLLSHSSHENLTKHWVRTAAISPTNVACYPCHRLHYSMDFCYENPETGAAICQHSIDPEVVFDGVLRAMGAQKSVKTMLEVVRS